MSQEFHLLAIVAVPFIAALGIWATGRVPNLREAVTFAAAAVLCLLVYSLAPDVLAGVRPEAILLQPVPGIPLGFRLEPLGFIFACVASFLWIVSTAYSIGYMRGNNEPRQTRFYICFAIAIGSTMGLALAENLFTLFLFYELLTLSTYPLVTHHKNQESIIAGRTYLGILMSTSIVFLLLAIIWTWDLAGTTSFQTGGILDGKVDSALGGVLLILFVYGIGKAALMPFHRWLPAAMVAPTPVSALLHAVAVVKAGVFSVVKVSVYIFGTDYLATLWSSDILLYIATFTLLAASVVAIRQDNLKRRLAYSTISQLSYVIVGAMLATSMGVIGAGMHIVMHAFGKITLFFCAGAIYTAAHKTLVSELNGMGKIMPVTFGAFMVGALSVIGLPPMGGAWSKFFLALGAADAGQWLVIAALMVSSLLNVAYLLSPVYRAFFLAPAKDLGHAGVAEAPLPSLLAIIVTSIGCLLLFFASEPVYRLLESITVN
jgi:multicomponent Na+:H+ antiporter subunit D